MKITTQSPGFTAHQELLDMIDQKVDKLGHLNEQIQEAHVILKTDKSGTRENKVCEICLVMPGHDIFTKQQANTFETAVHEAIDTLKGQITSQKEEKTRHRH